MSSPNMRYLFVGPSLPDAASLLDGADVQILPPIAGGELLRLPLRPGDVVGIIDGYFHQTRAVRHKEILAVLDAGVRVLGAASIGALRAAELDVFGMQGIGAIYHDYREGRLDADDEVALMHGPADSGYRPSSEPLVNIRATLEAAQDEGICDTATQVRLIKALAQQPYPRRSYPELIQAAHAMGLPVATIHALREFCATRPVNRKREDALALVTALRSVSPPPESARPPLARTVFLHHWELNAAGHDIGDGAGWVSDLELLRVCQLFASDYREFHRSMVLAYLARECAGSCEESPAVPSVHGAVAHAVHRGVIAPPQPENLDQFAFLDQWLTPVERGQRDLTENLATFLVRSFYTAPMVSGDSEALVMLRGSPVMAHARQVVQAARRVNEMARQQYPDFDIHALSRDHIIEWFARRWAAEAETLELHALDRGIESLDFMVAAARTYYMAAKYNPYLVDSLRMLEPVSSQATA